MVAANINGLIMDVTTSSSQKNYATWSAKALTAGLGIAASVGPDAGAVSDPQTWWTDLHTWQDSLSTDQHPAFWLHDIEDFTGVTTCWSSTSATSGTPVESLTAFVEAFKNEFPLYVSNKSYGCTSYGNTQDASYTSACNGVTFPWSTIVEEYPFYVPQVYGWVSGAAATDADVVSAWEEDSQQSSLTSGQWHFPSGDKTCAGYSTQPWERGAPRGPPPWSMRSSR